MRLEYIRSFNLVFGCIAVILCSNVNASGSVHARVRTLPPSQQTKIYTEADREFHKRHPELNGRNLDPSNSADAELRKEYNKIVEGILEGNNPKSSSPNGNPFGANPLVNPKSDSPSGQTIGLTGVNLSDRKSIEARMFELSLEAQRDMQELISLRMAEPTNEKIVRGQELANRASKRAKEAKVLLAALMRLPPVAVSAVPPAARNEGKANGLTMRSPDLSRSSQMANSATPPTKTNARDDFYSLSKRNQVAGNATTDREFFKNHPELGGNPLPANDPLAGSPVGTAKKGFGSHLNNHVSAAAKDRSMNFLNSWRDNYLNGGESLKESFYVAVYEKADDLSMSVNEPLNWAKDWVLGTGKEAIAEAADTKKLDSTRDAIARQKFKGKGYNDLSIEDQTSVDSEVAAWRWYQKIGESGLKGISDWYYETTEQMGKNIKDWWKESAGYSSWHELVNQLTSSEAPDPLQQPTKLDQKK